GPGPRARAEACRLREAGAWNIWPALRRLAARRALSRVEACGEQSERHRRYLGRAELAPGAAATDRPMSGLLVYRRAQAAVSAAIGANDEPPRFGRMKMLDASSGSFATLAQKAGHTPFWLRYCSTFDT